MTDTAHSMGRGAAAAIGAVLIFAGYFSVTRLGLGGSFSVGDLVAGRYLVPAALLLPVALYMGGLQQGIAGIPWSRAIPLTLCGGLVIVWLLTAGLQHAPSAQAGVFMSGTVPLFVLPMAWLILRERVLGWQIAGALLIFAGDALVAFKGFGGSDAGQWRGQIQFVGAGMCWALYSVLIRKWRVDPLRATIATSVLSGLVFLPYYLLVMEIKLAQASLEAVLAQAAYLGVLAGIAAVVMFTASIAWLGAARAAMFLALVPAFAALMAIPFGEIPSALDWLGVAVVTVGMPFALGWRPKMRGGKAPAT